jgi:type VI secretion system protein ImpC
MSVETQQEQKQEVATDLLQTIKSKGDALAPFLEAAKIKSGEESQSLVCSPEDLLHGSEEGRFISMLAALAWNIDPDKKGRLDKNQIQQLISYIDRLIENQVNEVIHHEKFQKLEATWRGLSDLVANTNPRGGVKIDILDVSKDELKEDFEDNEVDFTGSAFFKKIYIKEFDQYGGEPYGSIIGLYDLEHTPSDEAWLRTMGKIATVSHAPFVTSVSPSFFGCESVDELAAIKDLEGLMNQPKYSSFNALRESEEAAYLGLCLPRYVLRLPWHPVTNPCGDFNFSEHTWGDADQDYLWGNAAILFAKNLVTSFESSGWCQYIRGPKGGGLVKGLPVHTFNIRGQEEIKIPVEIIIPDHRELEFANCGFMPLIYRKGSGDACFFSVQSLKKPEKFRDPKDSENAQLTCNLSYTFSISRIAHYVKSIMRDNIGSAADGAYIQKILNSWIMDYVTTVTNPDDRTLRRFPFQAASVEVKEQAGIIGFYNAVIKVKPHIQFEGIHVELMTDARL